ncbi:MAG: hypothetical protein ACYCXF_08200 [Thermoleophilia bacterium]
MEVPRFFFLNLFATVIILVALSFSVPPVVNWLSHKYYHER